MTPFKLQDVERHLEEAVWLEGEDWQLGGAVKGLTEVERHLWVARVEADGKYEVEIQITPSKVKSVSCECSTFRENGMCGHIGAVLIELRALMAHRKREREAKKKAAEVRKSENKRRLTLDAVLEEAPPGELLAFIREYARHHRQFSLALKARFTPQVDQIQSREKYGQLLNTAISVSRKANRRISLRGVQKLAKVLEEVLFQAEGYFYAGHYQEVMDAAGMMLEKITPILNKVDRGREKLEVFLRQAFALLGKLADGDAPPALKRKLWDYALDESGKLFYRNQSMDVQFFQLLYRLAVDDERKTQLLKLVEDHLEMKVTQPEAEEEMLLLKLRLLEKKGDQQKINQFFKEQIGQPRLLKRAIDRARKMKDWTAARHWINTALEQDNSAEDRQVWQKLALEVAQESDAKQDILPLAMELFIYSGQPRYFDLALEQTEDSTQVSDEVLQRLVLESPRATRQEAIATVLSRTNRLDELLKFLEHSQSLLLLQKYDHHWQKKDQEKLFPIYRKLVMGYLKDHLGRITSQKIKNIIDFLYQTGRSSMAERLIEEMRKTYPERHSLMEELDII
ncbi:SWIM zinc finger family protein [Flavilitoribacter nigricans]|uniref:SWIM-type domain-containing protein n=1 Tax=Flavilitoribacter nigricans (strain ATCC 23147 / DSM 23189 / NBRC 102662 / NCIMB 1420 / SS-2) TaxID=1122177 RepID=A0A2D0N5Q8_FLAN2|nr:hypothetical protein [Flavilitoribacter nigricans]PHN03720.1 hypothetical protein CRP01_24510 [Flavilitoribacter nigricans DSM 23189 = NBRC 102662]